MSIKKQWAARYNGSYDTVNAFDKGFQVTGILCSTEDGSPLPEAHYDRGVRVHLSPEAAETLRQHLNDAYERKDAEAVRNALWQRVVDSGGSIKVSVAE